MTTNIVSTAVMVITLVTTNVIPIKPSGGFPERQFLTNVVQTTTYRFTINKKDLEFTDVKTNSSVYGLYLPIITTNLIPAHYEGPTAVPNK